MSLDHDFLLLDRQIDGEPPRAGIFHDSRAIQLHDDLVRYLGDTLAWIPTFNPSTQQSQRGLNMWGITVIERAGADCAERVFRTWAQLLACGPSVLQLTGCYGWGQQIADPVSAEIPQRNFDSQQLEGGYDALEFDRQAVVSTLQQLADYAALVRDSNGRLYLYHCGV
ncbi:hypothetical protein NA78x_002217 [Anatilimnocola sp. NA78]|uniref:hypothetical protein n=1 Tax=Anatilimnocola sp. NA78 TaxID=3415683 RepID=UPI003CE5A5C4